MSEQVCPKCGAKHDQNDVVMCFNNINEQIAGDWQTFLGSGMNVCTAVGFYDDKGQVVMLADTGPDWFYRERDTGGVLSDSRKMLNWIVLGRQVLPLLRAELSSANARIAELERRAELAERVTVICRRIERGDAEYPATHWVCQDMRGCACGDCDIGTDEGCSESQVAALYALAESVIKEASDEQA